MIPCSPPMMFVSMLGHAIFQTAGRKGPSTIERSYRRPSEGAAVMTGSPFATAVCLEVLLDSLTRLSTPPALSLSKSNSHLENRHAQCLEAERSNKCTSD